MGIYTPTMGTYNRVKDFKYFKQEPIGAVDSPRCAKGAAEPAPRGSKQEKCLPSDELFVI